MADAKSEVVNEGKKEETAVVVEGKKEEPVVVKDEKEEPVAGGGKKKEEKTTHDDEAGPAKKKSTDNYPSKKLSTSKYIKSAVLEDRSIDPEATLDGKPLFDVFSKKFIDPDDKRLALHLSLNLKTPEATSRMINNLRKWLDSSRLPAVSLHITRHDYVKEIQGSGTEKIAVYGHRSDISFFIPLIPINQDLPKGTQFNVYVNNQTDVGREIPQIKTVMTRDIVPVKELAIVPFNRYTPILMLLPGESFSANLVVGDAPVGTSARRLEYIERPEDDTLVIATRLNDTPLRLLVDTLKSVKASDDVEPEYMEVVEDLIAWGSTFGAKV
jgi:hypothetical protein